MKTILFPIAIEYYVIPYLFNFLLSKLFGNNLLIDAEDRTLNLGSVMETLVKRRFFIIMLVIDEREELTEF